MNSNNDNGDDDLIFIPLDQEKSQVLSSGKSKDLEIGKSTGTELYRLLVCIYCYSGWFIEWALVALNQKSAASILMLNSNKKTIGKPSAKKTTFNVLDVLWL